METDTTLIPRGIGERKALLYNVFREIAGNNLSVTAACEVAGIPRSTYYQLLDEYPDECQAIRQRAVDDLMQATKDQQDSLLLAKARMEIDLQKKIMAQLEEGIDLLLDDLVDDKRAVRDRHDVLKTLLIRLQQGVIVPQLAPESHEQADEMAGKAATALIDLAEMKEITLADGTVLTLGQPQTTTDS
jgi:hypothetical protein